MGEAFLMRSGGMNFRGLIVSLAESEFYAGQEVNFLDASVYADFGKIRLPYPPEECTFWPTTMQADTTFVRVSATIGGVKRTATVPVKVYVLGKTFANTPWDEAVYIARHGMAQRYWQAGDEKYLCDTANGAAYARVLDFNIETLHEDDERYNDPSYNNPTDNKAAVTLKCIGAPLRTAPFDDSADQEERCWATGDARLNVIPAILAENFPAELRNGLRLVKKTSTRRSGNRTLTAYTGDRAFLPSMAELGLTDSSDVHIGQDEKANAHNYGIPARYNTTSTHTAADMEWTLTLDSANVGKIWTEDIYRNAVSHMAMADAREARHYFPMFCI